MDCTDDGVGKQEGVKVGDGSEWAAGGRLYLPIDLLELL